MTFKVKFLLLLSQKQEILGQYSSSFQMLHINAGINFWLYCAAGRLPLLKDRQLDSQGTIK